MTPSSIDQSLDEVPEYLPDPETLETDPAGPVPRSGLLRFARMAGSSIAGRDAAPWVTDFLNAAYYRRPSEDREVDDLSAAWRSRAWAS
jgi:hypothetical protein